MRVSAASLEFAKKQLPVVERGTVRVQLALSGVLLCRNGGAVSGAVVMKAFRMGSG
jgi:hypothetical protein